MQEGRRVDEFLIITFTRAAAEELRSRIAGELNQAVRANPDNAHLRRQTVLLYQTQISTIHAFCTVLLRQFGHLLDVPTDFTLCEDEESQVLMARTLEEVLEARYVDIDPLGEFAQLLDVLSAGRDDSRLAEITLDVFAKIQSYPDPLAWLAEQREALELTGVADAGQTPWGRLLLEEARGSAAYWGERIAYACDLAQGDPALEKAYLGSLTATCQDLQAFAQGAGEGWDAAAKLDIRFPRLGSARNVEDKGAQMEIKNLRDRCKKEAEKLKANFESTSAALLEDMARMKPAMRGLLSLVEDFSAAYQEEKRRRALLDFSDLEHLTVRLLTDQEGRPTELARQWGSCYVEIMVDEYQDTNQVQNTIFDALSQEGKNLFMVGDVKQSIYRFRLADPTIFLEKYRRFAPWTQAKAGEPRYVTMSQNFRSRPQVLEACNDLFRTIMSRDLGEMDYTGAEALYPAGTFPPGEGYETEFHVLDFSQDPAFTEEKQNKHYLEARFVAREIAGLLKSGFQVSDGEGGTRPLRPEDIAILLRSPGPVRHYYTLALEEEMVAWSAEEGGDFFQTTEVSIALSWLQIIDNPRQDIPLLAVLRSPAWGFTGDRLAALRETPGDIYTAVTAAAARGEADCLAFLDQLQALRFDAGEQSSHKLLLELYRRTGLLEIVSAMPGGEGRRENLLSLYDLARRFEGSGHKGLFGFLGHLERVRASGGVRQSGSGGQSSEGVKILSIHRSKGLEYPVVFLCGLGRRFNESDLKKTVLFHPKLGLGPKCLDRETMVEFSTLARTGTALALKKELLAEEMRLLYVAMTRAKEKLIMTHALSYGPKDLSALADGVSYPADPRILGRCSSVGQWVLLTALSRPEGTALRRAAGREDLPLPAAPWGPRWRIEYHSGAASQEASRREGSQEVLLPTLPPEDLLRTLRWQYPYQALSAAPAKITATQLSQEGEEPGVFLLEEREEAVTFYRPQFAQESLGLTPAQRGTALHTAMQCVRLERTGSAEELGQEISRLLQEGYLSQQEAQAVEVGAMARFFRSPLGRQLKTCQDPHREYPFSLLAPADYFYPGLPQGEQVLLQGVIDCWFEDGEGITLLDFKTDHISAAQAPQRARRYQGQISAYAYALETVLGRPVRRRILCFLFPGCTVEL